MKTACVYHNIDLDGMSAAIVKRCGCKDKINYYLWR